VLQQRKLQEIDRQLNFIREEEHLEVAY